MGDFDAATFRNLAAEAGNERPVGDAVMTYLAALHPIGQDAAAGEASRRGARLGEPVGENDLPTARIIDLGALTPDMVALAAAWGVSIPILLAICNDQIGFAADGAAFPRRTQDELRAGAEILRDTEMFGFRNHQPAFFQAGGLVSIDPFSGQRLVSTHSFPFEAHHIAYRFAGLETFYVVIGGIGGVVRFFSFPRQNGMVLAQVPGEHEAHKGWSRTLHRRLMSAILRHGAEVAEIVKAPRHATGVAMGANQNLGHFIWQELSGLEEILQTHGPASVRHLLLGPYVHLPIADLFPELADRPVHQYPETPDRFALTLPLPYQHIRPTNVLIRPSLRQRIFRLCEARVAEDIKARMATLRAGKFVFWITLRTHNKCWVRQVDGHIAVLCRLAGEVAGLAVVLDGWTDTRDAANAVAAGLPAEIEIVDTIGCTLYETFLWARTAHLYSCVVSTGLHFTAHFAACPGVAHANSQHLRQRGFWTYLAPGSCPPTLLDPSEVRDMSDSGLYDNYDFDPDLLYQRLREIIAARYPERLVAPPRAACRH